MLVPDVPVRDVVRTGLTITLGPGWDTYGVSHRVTP